MACHFFPEVSRLFTSGLLVPTADVKWLPASAGKMPIKYEAFRKNVNMARWQTVPIFFMNET